MYYSDVKLGNLKRGKIIILLTVLEAQVLTCEDLTVEGIGISGACIRDSDDIIEQNDRVPRVRPSLFFIMAS
jgi:hypothetical protein